MREILFRGKGNPKYNDGGWYEGYLTHDTEDYQIYTPIGIRSHCTTTVLEETIGQYTGLTDKNGKKIFEGDIVKIMYGFGWDSEHGKSIPEEEYISKVYSIDACPFCVDLQHCDGDMAPIAWLDWAYDDVKIEIIGNIHDNPELLTEQEG